VNRLTARHPQWWVAVAVAVAWLVLLADLPAFEHHHMASTVDGMAGWMLMVFAMTVPLTLPAVRHVAYNSIRSRRQRAMLLYLAAYLSVWAALGIVALGLASLVDRRVLVIALLAVAAGWQLTRTKRRALLACRRTIPLPPQGRRADAACLRFGARQGWRCVVSCWPLMLLMAAVTNVLWMVALAIVMYAEERTTVGRRLVRPMAAVLAAAATATAVLG
jgi:predicted metal-binding membrane protein